MTAIDFKKAEAGLYAPKQTPSLIDVPEMTFLSVNGRGDPNTSESYAAAIEVLYGLSYSIKMSPKSGNAPTGYFEYVVPPLEGFWTLDDGGQFTGGGESIRDKSKFIWTMLIRQPDFVSEEVFEAAQATLHKKKPKLDLSGVRRTKFTEGPCAQVMHIGSYDDEPATIAALSEFIHSEGYVEDFSENRRHHEIYLGDPRKTAPEKLKTVIRHPIRPK